MKLLYISYLRIFAMLLVVLYHCLCYYTPIWTRDSTIHVNVYTCIANVLSHVHMPMFFFISGFLFSFLSLQGKYADKKGFLVNKAKRLLIPLCFWGTIVYLFIYTKSLTTFLYQGCSHLWFCGSLFLLFLFAELFRNFLLQKKKWAEIIIFAILLSISLIPSICSMPAIIARALSYSYIFFAGIEMAKYPFRIGKRNLVSIPILVALSLISFPVYHFILQLIGLWVVISLFSVVKEINLKEYSFIRTMDYCCMGVYLLHHIIIQLLLKNDYFVALLNQYIIMPLILFPIIVVVCWILTIILKRNKITSLVVG